jgi:hypothetical protein
MLIFTFHFSPRIGGSVTLEPFLGVIDTKKKIHVSAQTGTGVHYGTVHNYTPSYLTLDEWFSAGLMAYFRGATGKSRKKYGAMETVK